MSVRSAILQQMTDTAAQQKKTLAPLTDGLKLAESGMDSLCLALIVAALDDNLGLDPFGSNPPFPVTVGDFITLYENVA
ncbi:acyl carrier protein [Acidisphaera sp. L21]|uniref:acyl carrier protein n=1 Tax=Acidisphaera sp. L21 TaxID=1641851 RepID=UPI00131B787F|nr:acyl carrier protein [Acidisphaera sp. L21]